MSPRISILLPHYQTPRLTMLCLHLLRQLTSGPEYEVLVIDNGSADGSGERLRQIPWIRFFRRESPADERPARAHGMALNLGVQHARAPYILTMHTDTMVLRPDWLEYLIGVMEKGGRRCGIVGSWKMETENRWRLAGKWIEERIRLWWGRHRDSKRYIRTHCALYRRQVFLAHPAMFDPSQEFSAGEELYEAAIDAGFHCRFLFPAELGRYIYHLNHATMALNDRFGQSDPYMSRTRRRAIRRIESFFQSIRADETLADIAPIRKAG